MKILKKLNKFMKLVCMELKAYKELIYIKIIQFWMISMEIENCLSKKPNGSSEEMVGLMISDSEVLIISSQKEEILIS